MKNIILCVLMALSQMVNAQTFAKNASVITTSTASSNPLRITLNWTSYAQSTGYSIYRKNKTSSSWGSPIATLSGSSTQYIDNSVSLNTYYEYKITRSSGSGTGYGYTTGAVNLSEVEYRGKMILVVDNTFSTPLSSQISQLQSDLLGDGWLVTRIDVSRNDLPSSVRTQIQNIYNTDPTNFKSVFLLGHIPVYRSGGINPDGHDLIPWSCDTYYGEMNSTWSSSQTSLPSDMELEVGRVDLYNLPAFNLSESQLMINYLSKLHQFKIRGYVPRNKTLVQDNLDWSGDAISETGYRTSGLTGGVTNLTDIGSYGWPTYTTRMTEGYLFGFAGGGGIGYNEAQGIGSVNDLVTNPCNIIFTMSVGSYYGNWDCSTPSIPVWNNNTNNLLKAYLASGSCLTSMFSGIPSTFYHHMGLGDPIGYSTKITQNNRTSSATYQPQNGGWQSQGYTTIHITLLGDPTLRMVYVSQPSGFNISRSGGTTTFNWTSATQVDGYHIYEINPGVPPVRINGSLITNGSFISNSTSSTNYMIRSVKLENGYSGSYNNLSIGVLGSVQTTASPFITMRAFLGGPYLSNTMSDDLRSLGLIPLSDPYPSMGYSHVGSIQPSTINGTILNSTGTTAIIDWVIIELRNSSSPSVVVQSIPCLIRKDGTIVNTLGSSQISVPSGNYYVSIKHKNHLGCMTGSPISISSSGSNIDFTNQSTSTWGTGSRKQIGTNMVLWPGNAVFDNVIRYTGINNDRDQILIKVGGSIATNTVSGYFSEDVNMDGVVKYTGLNNDRDIILVTIGGSIATNVVTEQIP